MAATATPFVVLAVGGDAASLAVVSAVVLLVEVLALFAGGVIADRVPRQRVMFIADLIQALGPAVLASLVSSGRASVATVVVLSAVRGLGFGLFLPASQGILPLMVAPGDLGRANGLRRLVANVAQIAGALGGGVLVAAAGIATALWLIAAAFLIGAVSRLGMTGLKLVVPSGREGPLRAAARGWREFIARRWVWSTVAGFAVVNAVYVGCISVLGPLAVEDRFRGASSWGLIAAATAVGAALGAAAVLAWRPRRPLAVAMLFAGLISLEPFALATAGTIGVVAVSAAVAGLGMELFGILWMSVLQQRIPIDVLSRVSAFDAVGSFAISPLGPLLAGVAAAAVGVDEALMLSGVTIIAVCGLLLLVPDVRRMTAGAAERTPELEPY